MTVYKYGMTGAGVKNLQTQLNKLGCSLSVDGKYGALTSRAVSDFQEQHGLVVDGVAGLATQAAIIRAIREKMGELMMAALDEIAGLPVVKEMMALYD